MPIILNIKIVSEIEAFRKEYCLSVLITDEEITDALNNNSNWEEAYKDIIN